MYWTVSCLSLDILSDDFTPLAIFFSWIIWSLWWGISFAGSYSSFLCSMSYAIGLHGFVKISAYLLTNSHMWVMNPSLVLSEILGSWGIICCSWLLCDFALKWARGFASACNSEVSSVAMHCRFMHKAVLEGLHETCRFVWEAFRNIYEAYLVQVMPTRLLP